MIRKIPAIFLLVFFCIFSFSHAEEKVKKYPPYPEVWGYEFPWPRNDREDSFIGVRKADNGDYIVTYISKETVIRHKKTENLDYFTEWAVLHFFSKDKISFSANQTDDLDKYIIKYPEVKHKMPDGIILSDGTVIKQVNICPSGRCIDPFYCLYIEIMDGRNNTLAKKMLLYLYDKSVKKHIDKYCERNQDYGNNYVKRGVSNAYAKFVLLEDDTFLLYDMEGNYIIRFDKFFNTRSSLINKKLFILDRSEYENLRAKIIKTDDQSQNDAIIKYLKNIKEKEKER